MSGAGGGGTTANNPPNPILTQSSQFSRIRQSRPISANQIRTNTSDYQRMHEKAQIKCREMQSCLAYL